MSFGVFDIWRGGLYCLSWLGNGRTTLFVD